MKFDQFLAVNGWNETDTMSEGDMAMTVTLASRTTQRPGVCAGTDLWAGGDALGNRTSADTIRE